MGKPNRLVGPFDFGREAIFSKAQFFMALTKSAFSEKRETKSSRTYKLYMWTPILIMTPAY
jgi:hypothetical protein